MMKPFPFPKEQSQDDNLTGFYSSKNSSILNLRIQESDKELDGIIRLNKNNPDEPFVFEGFNGTDWVQFNAIKGAKGDEGENKLNQFEFINIDKDGLEDQGFIFKDIESNGDNKKVLFRPLVSEPILYNENQLQLNTLNITTKEDNILLSANPQPFNWDLSDISIEEMKTPIVKMENDKTSIISKCYGEYKIVNVKPHTKIERGQFVSLDIYENKMVVVPFNIKSDNPNQFIEPYNVFGVALEEIETDNHLVKIKVCITGITMVKYCEDTTKIDSNLMSLKQINKVGTLGLLSKDGFVFNCPIKPLLDINYIKVGYFIEENQNQNHNHNHNNNNTLEDSNDFFLFNIKL
jgi:hypothetical protein